jgi:hypothetical protein
MAQDLDLFMNLGALFQVGQADLRADDVSPKGFKPGAISMMCDSFGFRIFRYGRIIQAGGMAKGELASRAADVTGTVTAAAGESNGTTSLSDTANFTADNESGKICHITDNNDSAGAAPEGEVSVVNTNSVNTLTLDSKYPFSTAVAVNDTYRDVSVWLGNDSADADLAINVFGVIMAARTTRYYGWHQMYGLNPGVLYTTSAVTAGNPVVADVAAVGPHGCDTEQLWVGFSPGTIAGDLASPFRSLAFLDLLHMAQPVS